MPGERKTMKKLERESKLERTGKTRNPFKASTVPKYKDMCRSSTASRCQHKHQRRRVEAVKCLLRFQWLVTPYSWQTLPFEQESPACQQQATENEKWRDNKYVAEREKRIELHLMFYMYSSGIVFLTEFSVKPRWTVCMKLFVNIPDYCWEQEWRVLNW